MSDFWIWWQHLPYEIHPILLNVGGFRIHWYSIMYLVAFILTYLLIQYRIHTEEIDCDQDIIESLFMWGIIGVLVGGRLGYVVFYNPGHFLQHPLEIILPFSFTKNGMEFTGIRGMSYHGGLLGVAAAFGYVCWKFRVHFLSFAELVTPAVPLGYTFGRIGNFINRELYGRVTDVSWGMYFPTDPTHQLRHPSQLYEAFTEGILLFAVLWYLRRYSPFHGFLPSLYLIGYGVVRFFVEFYRMPDPHLGTVLWFLTTGQLLCLAMIAAGSGLLWYAMNYGPSEEEDWNLTAEEDTAS